MAKCTYCGTRIFFRGKADGDRRFCDESCYRKQAIIDLSNQVPETVVHESVWAIHQGRCPKCGGNGPVDVYVSYRVWSALVLTSWQNLPQVSCRSCGIKDQAREALLSMVLGWWGCPFGIIMTPVQVGRNIAGMFNGPDPMQPSAKLDQLVRIAIAQRGVAA